MMAVYIQVKGFENMISIAGFHQWKSYFGLLTQIHVNIVCQQSHQDQKNHPIKEISL